MASTAGDACIKSPDAIAGIIVFLIIILASHLQNNFYFLALGPFSSIANR